MDHQNIDLKQRDYQIFLQQTYVYSGSAENCKYQQAMWRTMKGDLFSREEKETGKAGVNKENMAFYWLSPCQERRGVFLLLGLCYCCRVWELPFLVSWLSLFNWSFCLSFFFFFYIWKAWHLCFEVENVVTGSLTHIHYVFTLLLLHIYNDIH